jgi:tetratricopeptide (TPR) repeat protein
MKPLDRILTGLVIMLVVFAPFALGGVRPWPAALIQIGVFVLVLIWAAKIAGGVGTVDAVSFPRFSPFVRPVLMLAGLLIFQLIPLPPGLMRVLSSSTYEVYAKTLQGWPLTASYSDKAFLARSPAPAIPSESVLLPTAQDIQRGIPVPFANSESRRGDEARSAEGQLKSFNNRAGNLARKLALGLPATWYPLAIAPDLTRTALLRFIAYAGLFFVIAGYPFADGAEGERRFYRLVLAAIVITGVLVAAVGLVERVYWNGRILWLFVPRDWGAPFHGIFPRATGPFVNPDHFANYLTMVFPLALAGAFYELYSTSRRTGGAVRLLCVAGAFIIFTAILLSLSRAAWIEATASAVVFSLLWANGESAKWKDKYAGEMSWRRRHGRLGGERYHAARPAAGLSKAAAAGIGLAAFLLVALITLLIVGPQGRMQSDARLGQTVASGGGLGLRPIVWKDSLNMVRDFPLFGVGLGGWPEIFPHYQTGPWNEYYFREAHNDYLQYITETGLLGVLALIWVFGSAGRNLLSSRHSISPTDWPLVIALALALGAMALHELVDFCLHIPANALLFTLLFAIVVRFAIVRKEGGVVTIAAHRGRVRVAAGILGVGSAILIFLALTQNGLAYPYDIAEASFPAQARAVVIEHPASARAHMALLELAGTNLTPGMRLDELATAIWLDPTDPSIRDLYAETLAQTGRETEALQQVTESVFNSPVAGTHSYLDPRLAPWLLPAEQQAIRQGFEKAAAAGYPGAIGGLGTFDDTLGDFSDELQLYADAARRARTNREQAAYFTEAGEVAIRAGNEHLAEGLFHSAIRATPSYPEPYVNLLVQVYGPAKNTGAAQSTAHEGIRNGADAQRLYTALSTAAQMSGNQALAESALLRALRYDPSFGMIMQVAQFYLQNNKIERAVSVLRNATEINPASADAYYLLGVAEEKDYQYSDADKAYARAAILAPQQFRPIYSAFRRRMDSSRSDG